MENRSLFYGLLALGIALSFGSCVVGRGLGQIRRAEEAITAARIGVFQITPRFSTEISDYGMNDVSAIEKDVTAVVHVTFALR